FVGYNDNGIIPSQLYVGQFDIRVDQANGRWIGVADMNSDGRDDLVELNAVTGTARVALATENGFQPVISYGTPGLRHDPANRYGVVFGDFNADGRTDVVMVGPDTRGLVALQAPDSSTLLPTQDW